MLFNTNLRVIKKCIGRIMMLTFYFVFKFRNLQNLICDSNCVIRCVFKVEGEGEESFLYVLFGRMSVLAE